MKLKSLLYFAIILFAVNACKIETDQLPKPKPTTKDTVVVTPVDTTTGTRIKRGDTLDICLKNGTVKVNGNFSGVKSYLWMPGGDTTGIKNIDSVGFYKLYITRTGTKPGSVIVDSSFVKAELCFVIPNVFTPNGDGKNDTWTLDCTNLSSILVNVFDRWGKVIYTANTIPFSWDGNYNGKPEPEGVYFYTVKCTDLKGKVSAYRGSLTLLR